jgi:site-specific recombinase XerD
MPDLLTLLRQQKHYAVEIADTLKINKSTVTRQLKGDTKKIKPEVLKEVEKLLGYSILDLATGKAEVPETKPNKKAGNQPDTKKIPDNVYELFKEYKKGVASDNQQRIYDTTIGVFLEAKWVMSNNENKATSSSNPNRKLKSYNKAKIYASSSDIIRFLNNIESNQYGKANANIYWRNLRTFFNYLEAEYNNPNPMVKHILGAKPLTLVPEPKVPENSVQPYITEKEVTALLNSPKLDIRDKVMIALPYGSAMRISEWMNIQSEDINFNTNTLRITAKGGNVEEADIDMAMPFIKAYLAKTGIKSGRLFQKVGNYKRKGHTVLEREMYGQLASRKSFNDRFKAIQPLAREITGNTNLVLTPHVFRRGNAILNVEHNIPDKVGMKHGRWKNQKTYHHYAESVDFSKASDLIRKSIKLDIGLPSLAN